MKTHHTIALAGNPNCGKTTLFNVLTGATQTIGNWPGVTVEKKLGAYRWKGARYDIIDLPGVYLLANVGRGSEDERVARDYILSGEPDLIVDILDASNLERNLYLTTQLLEMGVPLILALNMSDLAERGGVAIDAAALGQALGCPVVPMVASKRRGGDALKAEIARAVQAPPAPCVRPTQVPAVEKAIGALAPALSDAATAAGVDPRWVALKLIEGDDLAERIAGPTLTEEAKRLRAEVEKECGDDADIIIADGRFRFIAGIMEACHRQKREVSTTLTQRIDAVALNRFLGVPVFLLAMYLMFLFTIVVGGAFIDFFDKGGEALFIDLPQQGLTAIGAPDFAQVLVKGFGSGLQTIATFVPIIACLFLFLSILEDSGYMARAAFVMDRAMRAIGLPGKSFVPLIVGFGCNVPAVMATRTLETRRDRILTIMMAPFMSCGARLPVFALFAAAFFPWSGQNIVFLLYIIGILFAVMTGLILKHTLLRGEVSHFIMELPPYHVPTVRTVVIQAWQRLRRFILNAGQIIVPMVMVLSVLANMGTDGSIGRENTKDSVLASVSHELVPVFKPIGLTDENWPAAVGLFTGIFAKEAVVGTLNALYSQVDATEGEGGEKTAEESPTVLDKLGEAAATVPTNLAEIGGKLLDPLGIDVGYVGDSTAAAERLEVNSQVFGAMQSRFDGMAGAFAYMLLILLYVPCVAALGAIRHEVGLRWTAFATVWTTGTGYITAVSFYQIATYSRDPATAQNWLMTCALVFCVAVLSMWLAGFAQGRRIAALPAE
ncbi:Fe(2+) transporter permease subunit FeoB [Rhodomicrobium udaipurense]|uniref:Ferrous iron transport protein B n=3 Tax=Rhodomicrobium udaipurense TaxID=1202716 RepID=A0A8I1KKK5_9HYPH|nr:Fe(2+) transporter permease subunit FeoB [Rhodomicrobium udaipurense]MBJ7545052.1 Fe(2+) transporter permease subunit FeoB [Rhodomicrobium udaipurense]